MSTSNALPRPKRRTDQAAAYTGIAKSTLEKKRVYGGGCRFIRIGRVVLYDVAALDDWLEAHKLTRPGR